MLVGGARNNIVCSVTLAVPQMALITPNTLFQISAFTSIIKYARVSVRADVTPASTERMFDQSFSRGTDVLVCVVVQ